MTDSVSEQDDRCVFEIANRASARVVKAIATGAASVTLNREELEAIAMSNFQCISEGDYDSKTDTVYFVSENADRIPCRRLPVSRKKT